MSGFVKYGRYRALAAGIFLLAMAIMIGCSGMVPASALDLIGMPSGSLKVAGVAAGKYEGDYEVAVPAGIFAAFRKFRVAVNVTADEKVDSIVILDPALMNDAEFFLPIRDEVIEKQSLDVDVVSGVTYSSIAFVKAVERALDH